MTDGDVVDPIRAPEWARRAWAATPAGARVFLALAVIIWILAAAPYLGSVDPVTLPLFVIGAPLAEAAFVALPAALLIRRGDAPWATPLLYRGAVAVSLVTLLTPVVRSLPGAVGLAEPELSGVGWIVLFAVAVASAAAVATLARGLHRVGSTVPGPGLQVAAVLVGFGVVVLPIAATISDALSVDLTGFVPAGWEAWLYPIAVVIPLLAPIAMAALLMAVVRGLGDPARPPAARRAAAAAVALRVVMPMAIVALGVTGAGGSGLGGWIGLFLALSAGPWPTIALVVAFALGLGDPGGPGPAAAATPGAASVRAMDGDFGGRFRS
jgi:hypothetical protein